MSGKEASFGLLYHRYKRALFAICMRYAKSKSLAEDYLQEGFIQIFKKLTYYDASKGEFLGWSSAVMVNICLRQTQKWQSKAHGDSIDTLPLESYDLSIVDQLSFYEIIALIQKLPDGYRVVFNLFVMDGFSHAEISEKTGISVGASKSQLHKAKKNMAKLLEDHFPGIENKRTYG